MAVPINLGAASDWDEPLNNDPMFTSSYTFSTADITVTFAGDTVGSIADPESVFDTSGENGTKITKEGTTLYPIDSEFGFYVSDFENADQKILDGDFAEGWAGDLIVGGEQIGLVVSDSPTDTFKTPAVLGTWLAGLGGNTIKASTEHYIVMQNVLSDQAYPGDPDALYPLDDELYVIGGEFDGDLVSDAIADLGLLADNAGDRNEDGVIDIKDVLSPNETEIDQNIAASSDYSVTLKDDGKLLYRWGNTIKKPNDIRIDAKLDLPDDWDEYDAATGLKNLYVVTQAELVVHHTTTNNPNDQIRPEDFENEAAIGTLPTYEIITDYNADAQGPREVWVSTDDYYSGDGTLYPAGTILRDDLLAQQWADSGLAAIGANDGAEGFTNAWYTTMDREPFEPVLNEDGTEYADSGPRWRLKPDKYGQDLPSVVIPLDPSLPPPPTRDEVKYDVGSETQTVINLLDWGPPAVPLSISAGWLDKPGEVSANGMTYSNDFDVAVYIKGDIKPATLYSAELVMDYDLATLHTVGDAIVGTAGDDYLVGIGSNAFTGGAGADLFVVSYGASMEGVALTESSIADFEVGVDSLGLIGLGVTLDTFETSVSQAVVDGNLEVSVDGTIVATLTGVTDELEMEEDFLLANPGPGEAPDDFPVEDVPNVDIGTGASDTLLGSNGSDLLSGDSGDDTIIGSVGGDTLLGGEGDDLLSGGAGKDSIDGGDGADVIGGGLGDDFIDGGAGDDFLAGGGRDDVILGGTGDDTINGGDGDDTMTGGEGADVFVYNFFKVGDADVITDFEDGVDLIRMTGVENAPDSGLQGYVDALNITDTTEGALIDYQGHTVLIEGVMAADLTVDDFTFI